MTDADIQTASIMRDDILSAVRELRGELAGIRTRLDSLVAIEKQLSYQGGRLSAIEKRLTTLVETKLETVTPADLDGLTGIEKALDDIIQRLAGIQKGLAAKGRDAAPPGGHPDYVARRPT